MQDRAQLAAEQWQQQRPDLDGFSMAVIGRLGELSQVISRDHLLPFFAEHGLQAGEFDLLATLRRSGEPYALMPTALYESAMISSGGMTSRIDRLEKAGLISRGKEAQWRPCRLEAAPMAEVADWVENYRRFWDESLDRLGDYLAELQKGDPGGSRN